MIRKLLPSPMTFVLSIEIGLPFLGLSWPRSMIAGILFVLSNRATERIYLKNSNYLRKLVVIITTAIVNTLIYTLFYGKLFSNLLSLIKSLHINALILQGAFGMILSIMCLLLYLRGVAFFVEWLWARFKTIKEQDKSIPVENKIAL
jgi:hypothetical protein